MRQQLRSDFGSNRNSNPFTTGTDKRSYNRMSGFYADLLRGIGSGSHLLHMDFTGRLDGKLQYKQYSRYRRGQWRKYYRNCQ
jgi:hypothetical protein